MFFNSTPDYAEFGKVWLPWLIVLGGAIKFVWNKYSGRNLEGAQTDKTAAEGAASWIATLRAELTETHNNFHDTNERLESVKKTYEAVVKEKDALSDRLDEAVTLIERITIACRMLRDKENVAYWETDKDGQNLYVNDKWKEEFEIDDETLSQWIERVVTEDRAPLIKKWKRSLLNQDSATALAFRKQDSAGNVQNMLSIFVFIRSSDGDIYKIIGVTIPVEN